MKELLDDDDELKHYRTELEGTVLHYAVMHSVDWNKDSESSTIHLLTSHFKDMVNIPDKNGKFLDLVNGFVIVLSGDE